MEGAKAFVDFFNPKSSKSIFTPPPIHDFVTLDEEEEEEEVVGVGGEGCDVEGCNDLINSFFKN